MPAFTQVKQLPQPAAVAKIPVDIEPKSQQGMGSVVYGLCHCVSAHLNPSIRQLLAGSFLHRGYLPNRTDRLSPFMNEPVSTRGPCEEEYSIVNHNRVK
jgi:hypothetical protein